MFSDKFLEKHTVRVSAQINQATKQKQTHSCSHVIQFQLMAYSDGTSGCEPNICAHDLSCFPQGQSVEKYSDTIVSACVCMSVCVSGCSPVILQARIHTHTHAQSPEG